MLPYGKNLKHLARDLRKDQTDAEQRLWSHIRRKQLADVQFYRQKPIGPYIVDFYAPRAKLVIEIDGAQHREGEHASQDAARDAYLESLGLKVLRFDNVQVLWDTALVVEEIYRWVVGFGNPPFPPFFKGGKGRLPDLLKSYLRSG
jgi:very-short-patch-repair endonuclease